MKLFSKRAILMTTALLVLPWVHGQELNNTAGRMMQDESRLTIGGYGQIDYNQSLDRNSMNSGGLDVHRLVLMFG